MPDISPASIILNAMPSQARAYESLYGAREKRRELREQRTQESVKQIEKLFDQVKGLAEEEDVKRLTDAASSSKDPDSMEVAIKAAPVKSAKGNELKLGLLQQIAKARESAASVEASKAQTAALKQEREHKAALFDIEKQGAEIRRDYAAFQLDEAKALAPMNREEARQRGLLGAANIAAVKAGTAAQEQGTRITAEAWQADKALRDAKRTYETFEYGWNERMKKLAERNAVLADTTTKLRAQMMLTEDGRKLFGGVEALGGEDRQAVYNRVLDNLSGEGRKLVRGIGGAEAQAEVLAQVASLAQTDSDVLAAKFQRNEAVRNVIAERFYPEASKAVAAEVGLLIETDPTVLSNPTPQAVESYMARLKQAVMSRTAPPGEDSTLKLFGVDKGNVWRVALSAAIDKYQAHFDKTTRTVAQANVVARLEEQVAKQIPAGATPEQIEALRAQIYQRAGVDPNNPYNLGTEDIGNQPLDLDALGKLLQKAQGE